MYTYSKPTLCTYGISPVLFLPPYALCVGGSVADPHQGDADSDPVYHFDADPDPDFYLMRIRTLFYLMRIHPAADPNPSFQIKAQTLEKSAQIGS